MRAELELTGIIADDHRCGQCLDPAPQRRLGGDRHRIGAHLALDRGAIVPQLTKRFESAGRKGSFEPTFGNAICLSDARWSPQSLVYLRAIKPAVDDTSVSTKR